MSNAQILVFDETDGLNKPGPIPPDLAASITFYSSTDQITVSLPPSVTTMYVTSKYTDIGSSIALQIKPVGGAAVTVSETAASPTNISTLAGGAVIFTVTGMNVSATVATFGVQVN